MRVQVWRAPGGPTPGTDYADRLVAGLEQAGLAAQVRPVTDLVRHPVELGSCHLLTGGELSVRTRRAWPRGFRAAVRALAVAGRDGHACVVGVCFGAQALADVLSPGVVDHLPTLRVGLSDLRHPGSAAEESVPAFHYERVAPRFADRPEVRLLAAGSFPAVQAYAVGRALRAYQFHPEFSADDVVAVAEAHASLLAAFGQHPEEVRVEASLARDRLDPRLFDRTVVAPLRAYLAAGPAVDVPPLALDPVTEGAGSPTS